MATSSPSPTMTDLYHLITSISTDITSMRTDITSMRTDITSMRTDITSIQTTTKDIPTMQQNITSIRTDITSIQTTTKDIPTMQQNITSIQKTTRDIHEQLGEVAELSIRHHIKHKEGSDYAHPFQMTNLYSLCRLITTKHDNPPHLDVPRQRSLAGQLCNYIYKENMIPILLIRMAKMFVYDINAAKPLEEALKSAALEEILNQSSLLIKKFRQHISGFHEDVKSTWGEIIKALSTFSKEKNPALKKTLVMEGPVGFLSLQAGIEYITNLTPRLQMDCRGRTTVLQNNVIVEIGEIKKSGNLMSDAANQLIRSLLLLRKAAEVLHEGKTLTFIGKIFYPESNTTAQLPAVTSVMKDANIEIGCYPV